MGGFDSQAILHGYAVDVQRILPAVWFFKLCITAHSHCELGKSLVNQRRVYCIKSHQFVVSDLAPRFTSVTT